MKVRRRGRRRRGRGVRKAWSKVFASRVLAGLDRDVALSRARLRSCRPFERRPGVIVQVASQAVARGARRFDPMFTEDNRDER